MAADSSTSASAEASSGSMNPAERPMAMQFLCQNSRSWSDLPVEGIPFFGGMRDRRNKKRRGQARGRKE